MDGEKDGGWMDGIIERWMGGWMGRQVNGWMPVIESLKGRFLLWSLLSRLWEALDCGHLFSRPDRGTRAPQSPGVQRLVREAL